MRKRTNLQLFSALGFAAILAAAFIWYYDTYVHWQPKLFPFAVLALTAVFAAFTLFALWARGERKASALAWKTLLSVVVFAGGILFGVSFLINNVIGRSHMARQAAAVALPLCSAQVIVLYILLLRAGKSFSRRAAALTAAGLAMIVLVAVIFGIGGPLYMKKIYTVPVPPGLTEGKFEPFPPWGGAADFTVSPDGLGVEEVRNAIREARVNGNDRHFIVEILPGEYNIKSIAFDERDYDTTYSTRGGEAILNGGVRLEPKDFTPVNGDAAARLMEQARKNVVQIDLAALGLTAEDWGKIYSFG